MGSLRGALALRIAASVDPIDDARLELKPGMRVACPLQPNPLYRRAHYSFRGSFTRALACAWRARLLTVCNKRTDAAARAAIQCGQLARDDTYRPRQRHAAAAVRSASKRESSGLARFSVRRPAAVRGALTRSLAAKQVAQAPRQLGRAGQMVQLAQLYTHCRPAASSRKRAASATHSLNHGMALSSTQLARRRSAEREQMQCAGPPANPAAVQKPTLSLRQRNQ